MVTGSSASQGEVGVRSSVTSVEEVDGLLSDAVFCDGSLAGGDSLLHKVV